MGKIYWTKEVQKIMDDQIHQLLDSLISDTDIALETENETVAMIRTCRRFADKIIDIMTEKDREEEARMAKGDGQDDGGA